VGYYSLSLFQEDTSKAGKKKRIEKKIRRKERDVRLRGGGPEKGCSLKSGENHFASSHFGGGKKARRQPKLLQSRHLRESCGNINNARRISREEGKKGTSRSPRHYCWGEEKKERKRGRTIRLLDEVRVGPEGRKYGRTEKKGAYE